MAAVSGIRALEGTRQTIQYHGIDYVADHATKHIIKEVEIINEQKVARALGVGYSGSPFSILQTAGRSPSR